MKIKGILICFTSERDRYGNCYHALRYVSTDTGKFVEGSITGGESNVRAIRQELFEDGNEVFYIEQVVSKTEFKRLTADFEYLGCSPTELADKIVAGIRNRKRLKLVYKVEERPRLPFPVDQFADIIEANGCRAAKSLTRIQFLATPDQARKIENQLQNNVPYTRVVRLTKIQ